MNDIHKRLEEYLNESESIDEDDYFTDIDIAMMNRMVDFIMNLEAENLSEEQLDELTEIVDLIADENINEIFDEDEEEVDEAFSAKKVKIKPSERRQRRREYRKNRAALKMKAKKFRRTAKYKQWLRLKKRKAASGKTARGKRIRKFL